MKTLQSYLIFTPIPKTHQMALLRVTLMKQEFVLVLSQTKGSCNAVRRILYELCKLSYCIITTKILQTDPK